MSPGARHGPRNPPYRRLAAPRPRRESMSWGEVRVERTYPCSRADLWEELRHIDRHVKWMADAVSIDFLTPHREGVGVQFTCRTKIGPFVTQDEMTITTWHDLEVMGVEHRGLVRGRGEFTLIATSESETHMVWREKLTFPWWMAGPIGVTVAHPILRKIWSGNLRRLGEQLEN